MSDLRISADNRIKLAFSCHLYKVSSVLGKSLVIVFRILTCDPLIASYLSKGRQESVSCDAILGEDPCAGCSLLCDECKVEMLYADIFILELFSDLLCIKDMRGFPLEARKPPLALHCIPSFDIGDGSAFSRTVPCNISSIPVPHRTGNCRRTR